MGFSFLITSANMLESISMSDMRGASAAERSAAWESGWDSAAAPPEGRVATSSAASMMAAAVSVCALVMKARLDADARDARGADGLLRAEDDCSDAAAASKREMLNLMILFHFAATSFVKNERWWV